MKFLFFIIFLITQRLLELMVSKRNEQWLIRKGAIEYGQKHYPAMIMLHTAFIISLICEYQMRKGQSFVPLLLALFMVLISVKFWVIATLGRYWNTKIYRIPGSVPIKKGIYKYVKHPNYVIVVCEIAIIPLIFHLYYTALVFTLLNAAMLQVRITEENKALKT